jgi:hypothetical protein
MNPLQVQSSVYRGLQVAKAEVYTVAIVLVYNTMAILLSFGSLNQPANLCIVHFTSVVQYSLEMLE